MNDIWGKLSTLIVYIMICSFHDDVIKWKHFPRNWPFVWGIHRSPVNSPHKGQWRGALMFSLICVWINGWVNNREAGDLRRHRNHYDVSVMYGCHLCKISKYMIWFWIELKYWWVHYLLQFIIIHIALKLKNLFQNAPVDFPYKGPVTRKLLPWYEVSMHFIDSKLEHHYLHYH